MPLSCLMFDGLSFVLKVRRNFIPRQIRIFPQNSSLLIHKNNGSLLILASIIDEGIEMKNGFTKMFQFS